MDVLREEAFSGRCGIKMPAGSENGLIVARALGDRAEALRQRTRGATRRVAAKQKRSTAASTAILAEAEYGFLVNDAASFVKYTNAS